MASDAFSPNDMGLSCVEVEADGLVAAVLARDVATSAADALVAVDGWKHLGVAVEVGGPYEGG